MLHAMDGSGFEFGQRQWCKTLVMPSDVIGKSFNELLTPQSRSHLITMITRNAIRPVPGRRNVCSPQGRHTRNGYAIDECLSRRQGRIERSICPLHDVTNQKIAEIASARSASVSGVRFRGGRWHGTCLADGAN
jgi:hypothetical protein